MAVTGRVQKTKTELSGSKLAAVLAEVSSLANGHVARRTPALRSTSGSFDNFLKSVSVKLMTFHPGRTVSEVIREILESFFFCCCHFQAPVSPVFPLI